MTNTNSNISARSENKIDLSYLRNKCFEIQVLIYSACGDIGFAEIPLAPRALFKGLKPLLSAVLDHIDHDDELSLILGRIEALARMIILAGREEHDLCSIEHILYAVLNDFRKAAGIPEVEMMDCDDLDRAQREANKTSELTTQEKVKALIDSAMESHTKAYDAMQSINNDGPNTFVNAVTRAGYTETGRHLRVSADFLYQAWEASCPEELLSTDINDLLNRSAALRAVCGLLADVPESDYKLPAIDWLIFTDMKVIKNAICELGGTEVQS